MRPASGRAARFWLPVCIALAAVGVFGRGMSRAGVDLDDAQDALIAGTMIRGYPYKYWGIRLFGRNLPLATGEYVGPWTSYLFVPFLAIPDPVWALRASALAWGSLAALLVYW
jgi:hypothetical protein